MHSVNHNSGAGSLGWRKLEGLVNINS